MTAPQNNWRLRLAATRQHQRQWESSLVESFFLSGFYQPAQELQLATLSQAWIRNLQPTSVCLIENKSDLCTLMSGKPWQAHIDTELQSCSTVLTVSPCYAGHDGLDIQSWSLSLKELLHNALCFLSISKLWITVLYGLTLFCQQTQAHNRDEPVAPSHKCIYCSNNTRHVFPF